MSLVVSPLVKTPKESKIRNYTFFIICQNYLRDYNTNNELVNIFLPDGSFPLPSILQGKL